MKTYKVYVPDQGEEMFSEEQYAIYKDLVFVIAVYVDGVEQ